MSLFILKLRKILKNNVIKRRVTLWHAGLIIPEFSYRLIVDGKRKKQYEGAASLISPRVLLTAAHIVDGK